MDLPVTKVPRGAPNKAEALRLQYLEPSDVIHIVVVEGYKYGKCLAQC